MMEYLAWMFLFRVEKKNWKESKCLTVKVTCNADITAHAYFHKAGHKTIATMWVHSEAMA